MKNKHLIFISILMLVVMVQVFVFPGSLITYADTYTCGNQPLNSGYGYACENYPLNSGIVYDCGNSPLNAGGTAGHYEGGTVCSPYSVTICNICGNDYYSSACPHTSGTTYGGTVCSPYTRTTTICNICGNNYYSSACSHYSGSYYNGTVCSPYSSTTTICNICGSNYYSSACPHSSGVTYGGTKCTPYSIMRCNICGNNYSGCPHYSGQTYGGTWIPATPNTYHVHNTSCAYHYTSHIHSGACPRDYTTHTHTSACEILSITNPATDNVSLNKGYITATWSSVSGAIYSLSLTDTTVNMKVLSDVGTGTSTSCGISDSYLYEGHNYRISVKATNSSGTFTTTRDFKINLSSARNTIISRGTSMINYSWTAASNLHGWKNNYIFAAGKTHPGIPYSQTIHQSSITSVPWNYNDAHYFDTELNSSSSGFYDDYPSGSTIMPMYGNDCSGFVSISWDIARKSTADYINYSRVGKTSETKLKQYARMSPGDAFVYRIVHSDGTADGHTLIVKEIQPINDSTGKVTNLKFVCNEQTPAYCIVKTHYADELNNGGYIAIYKDSALAQDYTWDWK